MRHAILLSVSALAPTVLAAQTSPLIGSWSIIVAPGTQTEIKGALSVRIDRDSLIGLLKFEPGEDMPDRPATRLAAKADTGAIHFVSRRTTENGQGSATLISTYELIATGDALKGTLTRQVEGNQSIRGGPETIAGKRVK